MHKLLQKPSFVASSYFMEKCWLENMSSLTPHITVKPGIIPCPPPFCIGWKSDMKDFIFQNGRSFSIAITGNEIKLYENRKTTVTLCVIYYTGPLHCSFAAFFSFFYLLLACSIVIYDFYSLRKHPKLRLSAFFLKKSFVVHFDQ